jgi:hypothetical protein
MTVTVYPIRVLNRNLGATFDSTANTISVQGQSISVGSLSASLQALWAAAVAGAVQVPSKPSFSGTNIDAAIGQIMDQNPTWRSAVQAAVTAYIASVTSANGGGDPESWTR